MYNFNIHQSLEPRTRLGLPTLVQNLKKSSPESVPEDKNTGFNDGNRSGLNKQNETL